MPFRIACIIDTYGWAWDRTSKDLITASKDITGDIFLCHNIHEDFHKIKKYDVILVYPWAAKDLLKILEPVAHKTIICQCSGAHNGKSEVKTFGIWTKHFKFVGANNEIIRTIYQSAFPKKCVIVLSHGTNTEWFKPEPNTAPPIDKKLVIGWAGGSRELKRLNKAKAIIDLLISRGIPVEFRPSIYNTTSQKSFEDMPDFYRSCNCFLITSRAEAHPLVAYESMACGLPLITTKVGDLNDTIISGANGIMLDIEAPIEEFANVLETLHNAPKTARRLGAAARQTILQRWSWDAVLPQYECLQQLLES